MSHLTLPRPSWALALLAATTLALSACSPSNPTTSPSSDSPAGGTAIEIGSLYEPGNLSNVDAGGQGVTEALSGNVYEGLTKLNDDGSVTNLLATGYTISDDGLAYTFSLRPGVNFGSGKALTSADVKASYERVVAEDSQAARKSSYAVVDQIDTPDDLTVVFRLKSRSISFPYYLAYVWIVNSDLTDLKATADGTGPYLFDSWQRGSTLSLVRNNNYWGDKAKNERVTFHYYTDASAESNALLTGQLDLVTSIQSPDLLSQFENNADFKITNGTSTTKEILAFNDRVKPFDDARVRQAIYDAVDRAKLLQAIWGDYGSLIGSMVPPTDPWYEDLNSLHPYDPALAKTLLADAGYPDGFAFTLDTPTYDPHPTVAEFLVSELGKIGVQVTINSITADEWYTKVYKERNYEATLQEHVNDRDVVWYGNPDFYWGYNNPTVIDLVGQAEQTATPAEQAQLLKQANQIIAEEAASVWLYLYPQLVVARSNINGYPVNGLNSQFFAYDIAKA